VATPNSKTTNSTDETANEMPAFAKSFREQLVSTVQQSQQLSVDAAQTWVKAVSVLPVHHLAQLPKVPGFRSMPNLETATKYTFDVAAELLNAQREYALQLTSALVPAKKS
jgi:hypothetical protein